MDRVAGAKSLAWVIDPKSPCPNICPSPGRIAQLPRSQKALAARLRIVYSSRMRKTVAAVSRLNHFRPTIPLLATFALMVTPGFLWSASVPAGKPAGELDVVFQRESGWTGADGDFSVPLSRDTTLWLFGDTWVGEIKDGRRTNTTLVNNSVALQRIGEQPKFFYGSKTNGHPAAFVTPADQRGYFWPFHGLRTGDGLHLFLEQVENVPGPAGGAFNFRMAATWHALVSNPDDPPPAWRIAQVKLPFGEFGPDGDIMWGSWLMRNGDFVYIYGLDSRKVGGKKQSALVAARVAEQHLGEFKEWRFYANGSWQSDPQKLSPLCAGFPTEFSISYLPGVGKFAAVYMEKAISGKIQLRLAATPIGPWGEPSLIYECPEQSWPEKVFCYSAKAHPELAGAADELIVTYAANSWEFANVMRDARLYWPRFVRVKLDALKQRE